MSEAKPEPPDDFIDDELLARLRPIARRMLEQFKNVRERPNGPTSLIHRGLLKLIAAGHDPRGEARQQLGLWIVTMHRLLIELHRQQSRRPLGLPLLEHDVGAAIPDDQLVDALERAADVAQALDELESREPTWALVMRRRHFDGLTWVEIARELRCTEANARRLWRLAAAALRRILKQMGWALEDE